VKDFPSAEEDLWHCNFLEGRRIAQWSLTPVLLCQAFEETYKREFGFVLEGRSIAVDDVRVRAMGKVGATPKSETPTPPPPRVLDVRCVSVGRWNCRTKGGGVCEAIHSPADWMSVWCFADPGVPGRWWCMSVIPGGLAMQAVPLPESKSVTKEPDPLPEPSKVASAYFEVMHHRMWLTQQKKTAFLAVQCSTLRSLLSPPPPLLHLRGRLNAAIWASVSHCLNSCPHLIKVCKIFCCLVGATLFSGLSTLTGCLV